MLPRNASELGDNITYPFAQAMERTSPQAIADARNAIRTPRFADVRIIADMKDTAMILAARAENLHEQLDTCIDMQRDTDICFVECENDDMAIAEMIDTACNEATYLDLELERFDVMLRKLIAQRAALAAVINR